MDALDRQMLRQHLCDGRDLLLTVVRDLSDAQSRYHPAGRWSILECVEHVVITEELLLHLITEEFTPLAQPGTREREAKFLRGITNRSRRVAAPEEAQPGNRFSSLPAAVDQFVGVRQQSIAYVETCREDLRSRSVQHPVLGPVTCLECLVLLALHPARHAAQIREIKEDPAYPGGSAAAPRV